MREDSEPSDRPKRAKHSRSKRGCRVCRIRRIRCDLTKPSCTRCTSTGRKCEGYPIDIHPDADAAAGGGRTLPAASALAKVLVPRSPSVNPHIDSNEHSHLSYFQHQTAHHFGGYLEDQFWSRLVLQLGTSDNCVLYVTIALGSLHRKFEQGCRSPKQAEHGAVGNDTGYLYAKAVTLLQGHIAEQGWRKLEVTLVCCILCTGFEWLRGDPKSASVHLRAGLEILQQWQTQTAGGPSYWSPAGHLIRNKLAPFYTRLALQAGTVPDWSLPWNTLQATNTTIEPFQSLHHARDSLCNLLGQVYLIPERRELLRMRTSKSLKEHKKYETLLSQWAEYFHAYTTRETLTGHVQASAIVLWLLYIAATVMLPNMYPDAEPGDTKDETDAFGRMVNVAERLFSIYTSRFSIDLGWVAPLYYVAANCRQPQIREKALRFLASHQSYEGSWSSPEAVLRAKGLM
ncbi:uncharacterized protein HMPREF1541_02145 [Cyphellophora europaea CBS 101466]|uniref:Zn(2)-C6 fungal-type domain-containing protein n=1 Tax=Cyphellophora europaea (strain CBS 101466) TaxID=1220924 RepID=W2S2T2_CYPE1|nr:uncharacterized protein HMPREF1541_02145 [Cyphellophora europaea CBS 101466]ETN42987.1 hypothetical protein HMPREF1541_02145 [Cyphellophora europaea CBS 101466]